mgnify:CR=1 FL=1
MEDKAPRICNRDGCTRHVFARAKCVSHYNAMIKSLRRKGSNLFAVVDTWEEVQNHMPATVINLAEKTGISYNTVMRTINKKYRAGEAHVVDHIPPQKAGGARWVRVFAAGHGVDHVVTAKRKVNYARKRKRELAEKRKAEPVAAAVVAPLFATRWNLKFFNPKNIERRA